ncbi:MAG TPA: hypothetical protein VHH32_08735 [Gemmatimonadales bacterium]|nr:hypothetical protein [Gemmatimonadales bacterium]
MVAEDLRRIQEDLRLASEQARQSAEDARQAAADLRIALDHALKAAAEQLITMQQLRESLARSRDATWD